MNHGIVVGAPTIALATVAAIALEKAMLQLLAQPTPNATVEHTSASEAEVKRSRIWSPRAVEAQWQYYVRRLGRAT